MPSTHFHRDAGRVATPHTPALSRDPRHQRIETAALAQARADLGTGATDEEVFAAAADLVDDWNAGARLTRERGRTPRFVCTLVVACVAAATLIACGGGDDGPQCEPFVGPISGPDQSGPAHCPALPASAP